MATMVDVQRVAQVPPRSAPVAEPVAADVRRDSPAASDRRRHAPITRGTLRLTHGEEVYVRTGPSKLVIGTLRHGDHFQAHALVRDGQWAWGHAGGQAARWGWVYLGNPRRSMFTQVDRTPSGPAGPPHDYTARYAPFVRGREKARERIPFTRRARVINPEARLYGNVTRRGRGTTAQHADFERYPLVGLRYSPFPGWVTVFRGAGRADVGHSQWGLMRRSDVMVLDDPRYERWQQRRGVSNDEMWGRGPTAPGA